MRIAIKQRDPTNVDSCGYRRSWQSIVMIAALALSWGLSNPVLAAEADPGEDISSSTPETAPVVVDGVTLFEVRGVSAFPAARRADQIADRIVRLAGNSKIDPTKIQVTELTDTSVIIVGDEEIMRVHTADALVERVDRAILARTYASRVGEAIASYRAARTPRSLLISGLLIALATISLGVFVWLGGRGTQRLYLLLDRRLSTSLQGLEEKSQQMVRATQFRNILRGLVKLLWFAACLIVGLWYLQFSLDKLPWTRSGGYQLLALLIEPLDVMGKGLLSAIPNLIFLAVLYFIVRYALKALRVFFAGIADGMVQFKNFDPDWSWPTYQLVRMVVVAFAIVVAFPYIPGSSSEAFKGVTVFLGVIFSLGSSSVIANVVAGYTINYRRTFKVGDRIKVGEYLGDVVEARFLGTLLRTLKNEDIVVPNSVILNSSVVNYSMSARQGQLVLYTKVGIGYETPWRQVEAMLIQAAERTEGIQKEPRPFVLQQALGDFCVTYEINIYCDDAKKMLWIYSSLHRNILDVFNEYGVQIMTPAYMADPPTAKIVPREQWYAAPAAANKP